MKILTELQYKAILALANHTKMTVNEIDNKMEYKHLRQNLYVVLHTLTKKGIVKTEIQEYLDKKKRTCKKMIFQLNKNKVKDLVGELEKLKCDLLNILYDMEEDND